ncbi:hypothetical protein TWF217_008073 [Orbilia oligospora]|nr:hypothetical protein TWF217_008073 [Orbilia oligospora]
MQPRYKRKALLLDQYRNLGSTTTIANPQDRSMGIHSQARPWKLLFDSSVASCAGLFEFWDLGLCATCVSTDTFRDEYSEHTCHHPASTRAVERELELLADIESPFIPCRFAGKSGQVEIINARKFLNPLKTLQGES